VEKTIRALRKMGMVEIKAYELIQREMVVGDKGIRPSFDMLGHTGYMTFARKVG
jgi:tRNA (adenine57-N1/adenine58-N1)-methyltransferase